jgi:bis(5'-nucleosyl)-tetraphosphatase (symmetrical)
MATYAIGDLQGCFDELLRLLVAMDYDRDADRLWFVGDLVNRGPQSLDALRFVRSLGERAITVLGNHDLHLLAVAEGFARPRSDDTLDEVLDAPDREELLAWLRRQPLLHREGGYVLVHAGLLPQWNADTAAGLAVEVERKLRGAGYAEFLSRLYGGKPDRWSDDLRGSDRLRVIVNAMTRLRFCTPEGVMDFKAKGETDKAPPGYLPWFEAPGRRSAESTVVCGHWSALGVKLLPRLMALDSGCVWGGKLTAIRLEDRRLFQVHCSGALSIGD